MSGCEEIKPRLAAFLDGEVEDPDAIEAHLDSCPECRGILDMHKKVCRLTDAVAGLAPSNDAWSRVEGRMSNFPSGRLYALLPVAAAACIAVIIYFMLPGGNHESIGSLIKKLGPVSIRPFYTGEWVETKDEHNLQDGDRLRTGTDGVARLDLGERGYLVMDADSELGLKNGQEDMLFLEILSGRACVCVKKRTRITVGCFEIESCSCEALAVFEKGNPAIYVRSGGLCCCKGQETVELKSMRKVTLEEDGKLKHIPIEDAAVFEWADRLLAATQNQ